LVADFTRIIRIVVSAAHNGSSCTRFEAICKRFEIVAVAIASSVDEEFTLARLVVVEIPEHGSTARTRVLNLVTDVIVADKRTSLWDSSWFADSLTLLLGSEVVLIAITAAVQEVFTLSGVLVEEESWQCRPTGTNYLLLVADLIRFITG
jgi:hypothetical protein